MLLFAILQFLATRSSMLLPVALISLVAVPLVLVNVLTIDAPKPSTTVFSLDSVEAFMYNRPVGNGLYAASDFVHPMAGKIVKNIALPYMCGSPEGSIPPSAVPSHDRLHVDDISSRNSSHLVHSGVSKHFEKDATKSFPRRTHPAFMALGLGLDVHASNSHIFSPLLPLEDIQVGRGVHRSARLSPFQNLPHPFYAGILLPLPPRTRWILWIDTLPKATVFLVLILLAPFLNAPLARLECKMGFHPEHECAQARPFLPPSIILDILIPSNGDPWTMLRTPEPLSDRPNVYTWVDGMSNMQPIYRKTEPPSDDFFLFVNREDSTSLVFAAGSLPQLLRAAKVPPTSGVSSWLHSPQAILLAPARTIGLVKRPYYRALIFHHPLFLQPTPPARIFFNVSAVQFASLAFLASFNLSRLRLTANAIGLPIIFLPKSFILGAPIQFPNDGNGEVADAPSSSASLMSSLDTRAALWHLFLSRPSEVNAMHPEVIPEKMEEALEDTHTPSPTLIESIDNILEVDDNNAPRIDEANDETVNNIPRFMSPTTAATILHLLRRPKTTSLLKRDRRKRFFQLWLWAGLKEKLKSPVVTLEATVDITSDEEDDDDEVFDYLSSTGLRQKSTSFVSELKAEASPDHEQVDDDDDDDDEVFDYLSPTGLRQWTASTHDLSLVSSDDSALSCCSDWGLYSSTDATPKLFIEDSVPCDIGDLFAPESPVITVSLSRRESFETVHVLDIGDNKGHDTDALFEDDSGTITVSLSSSSSLNQLSETALRAKIEQEFALGAPRSSAVAKPPLSTFSSWATLDFVELFMSIYCKDQSVDRNLSSSIHAPDKTDHVARRKPLNHTRREAHRVDLF